MNGMARFCAEDNEKLIEHLKNKGVIKSPLVFETMCLVDRKKYVNHFNPFNNAYIDAPQNIGHGRTISAPHMHGVVFEILAEKLITAKNALCIRCSTGYVSNCMAIMMGPYGTVFHIESIPELIEKIKKTIESAHPYLLWGNRIQLLDVDNESAGYPQPKILYDVIYVGAAAAEIPQALIAQLAFGGRLVIPIGSKDEQKLMQIDKTLDGKIEKKTLMSVRYGYLDGPREITKESNIPKIIAENRSNEKSAFNSSTESLNNTVNANIKTQSTKIHQQTTLPTKPVHNHFNDCMKGELASITTEKLRIKTNAQLSIKKTDIENLQTNLQTILHGSTPTIEKELESKIENKDVLQNVQRTEGTQIQIVSSLELNSKSEPVLDEKIEIKTIMDKLTPTHANKVLEEKIEETYQKNFDKVVEKLKNDFKVENLQNIYVDSIMKKLTLLLDKKLETKIDENLSVKIGSIEQRVILIEEEITKFDNILKQETNEQKIFLCEMDKALKIKIEKLNNKIVKVKECIDEKIIDEVDELSKQLKMIEEANELFAKEIKKLSIAFEERLLEEKAKIYMQIDAELEEKEQRQLNSAKNNMACFEKELELLKKKLSDKETNKGKQRCYCFIVIPTIITFHATYALFKNLS